MMEKSKLEVLQELFDLYLAAEERFKKYRDAYTAEIDGVSETNSNEQMIKDLTNK